MDNEEVVEEKPVVVKDDDPVPYFKIGAQTFHSGIGSHPPDAIIPWEVPSDWKEEKWGKHYASRPPSVTWTPMNAAARVLHEAQLARVKQLTAPPPPPRDEKFERMMEMQAKQMEQNQRLIELLAKALGADEPEDEKKGKKKKED